jgi:hypothetical protein
VDFDAGGRLGRLSDEGHELAINTELFEAFPAKRNSLYQCIGELQMSEVLAVCFLLSAVFSTVCCLLSAICCLLFAVCHLPSAVCRLLCPLLYALPVHR